MGSTMLDENRKLEIEEEEKLRDQIKNKKRLKKSRGCLIYIGLGLLLIIIWSLGSNKNDNKSQNNISKQNSVTETSVKNYQLGQSFDLTGDFLNKKYNWHITKSEVKKIDSHKETCGFTRNTFTSKNGKYYVVILEGENKASEEFDIDMTVVSNLILVSKDGKKYSQNDIDMEAPYRTCNFGIDSDDANPGSIAKSAAVFDVPEQEYKVCDKYMKSFCIEGIK